MADVIPFPAPLSHADALGAARDYVRMIEDERAAGRALVRLLSRSDVTNTGCWLWRGHCDRLGYGRITHKRRNTSAHRLAYELLADEIPAGLELHHVCHNRNCINPSHLSAVTHAENMALSEPALRTHCRNGHPLSGDNLYVNATSGSRQCRACMKVSRARHELRRNMIDKGGEDYPVRAYGVSYER